MAYTGQPNWNAGNEEDYFNQYNNAGYYQRPTAESFANSAQQFRQIYEEPQRQAITRKLEQSITDAQNQTGKVSANYHSFYDAMQRREGDQRRSDLESAISRGAGRSGVVNYMDKNRDAEYSSHYANAMAQKMAEKNAIENQLALVQRQVPQELIDLAEQGSRLEAQELQRLQDLDYTRGMEYDQDQWARALGIYDRTRMTPLQALQLYLAMAEVAGKFPDKPPSLSGM